MLSGMPERSNVIEISTYMALCQLYWLYSEKAIDLASAGSELVKLCTTYGRDSVVYRMFCEEQKRYNSITHLMADIEKNGSERERQLVRIMDGRERMVEEVKD